jgi:crotonobetainyl-CoA:carnitine CoA-transferase CaiB-like acyl-CoA transferase
MASPRLLQGIRIVDLTSIVFGPYATEILADLGADVIKVEPPGGDGFRHAGLPKATRGMGPCNMALNHGKRSVALDLKLPDDAAALRDLIAGADVFIHNVREHAIERLGFGYEACRALKPDIVYVHCVGFGSDGPYAGLQAYDDVIQAATGTATLLSRVDGDPRPRYLPSLVADKVAGLHGAYAMLAAIIHQLRTGEGQFVEVPMFEAFTHFMMQEHLWGATFAPPTYPAGYPRQLDPNRQPFPTADGYVSIVPYTQETVIRLFALMGADDVLREERFATPKLRAQNMTKLYAEIARRTPARTTAEWVEILAAAELPAMPVRDLDDILDDPHLRATGFFQTRDHPTEGEYVAMRPPVRFWAAPHIETRPPPLIGQHNDELASARTPGRAES